MKKVAEKGTPKFARLEYFSYLCTINGMRGIVVGNGICRYADWPDNV